ncbi:MAG TPA: exopolysaccharide biosynthesis polyprenyl glycosylphosphotransferase [Candidatus Binataceae bacterium]|nr:exopolysaccharide biosynthesis polyprenyl glycosylphosphotransferase [Candidatus Binataceae bacterium]
MINREKSEYSALLADAEARGAQAVIPASWDAVRVYAHDWPTYARVAILLLVDLLALVLSAAAAYGFWAYGMLDQPIDLYKLLFAFILLVPIGYAAAGLYPGFGIGAPEAFRRLCLSNAGAFLVIADLVFLLKLPAHYSRMTFVITFCVSLVLVPTGRLVAVSITDHWAWWRKPAILIGSAAWAAATADLLNRRRAFGYKPIGVIVGGLVKRAGAVGSEMPQPTAAMLRLAEQGRCAVIVQQDRGNNDLATLVRRFRHVMVLMEDFEGLPIENSRLLNFGSMMGLQFTNNLMVRRNWLIKRTLDTVIGGALMLAALPIIALAAGLILIFDGTPIFYSQEREGRAGRIIKVLKLRTMCRDSERKLAEALAADPALRQQWDERCKLVHDPRVIPVIGSLLRRFSIDELPQLWSVARGEMSLVGPRPFPEYHLRRYPEEYRKLRHQLRPGLTGLCQVMVRSDSDLEAQRRFDTYYICNWSVWLDLYIMARTFWAVLTSRGAY